MDTNYISSYNIGNIYEYVNAHMVRHHQYDLNQDPKYAKIVRKLVKTIYNNLKNNQNYKNITLNEFNNISQEKTVAFLVNDIKKKTKKKSVSNNNYNNNSKKTRIRNDNYDMFLEEQEEFENQVKEANRKIKQNFKKLLAKDTFQKNKECNNNITNDLVIDRCSTQDAIKSSQLEASAFEEILESKLNKESDTKGVAYDNYEQPNMKNLLSQVLVKQKDNTSIDKVDGFENSRLGDLITEIGESAEIQPSLYQNTRYGSERINRKILVIDSGGFTDGTAGTPSLSSVVNISGNNTWENFKINFIENIKIDKLTDVYLRSFTIYNTLSIANASYFVMNIDEFSLRTQSNNIALNNKIVISNPLTAVENTTTSTTIRYSSHENYVTTINPQTLSSLTINLTNQDNNSGAGNVFSSNTGGNIGNNANNRVIFQLELISKPERDNDMGQGSYI